MSLIDYFPFEEARPLQIEAMKQIEEAYKTKNIVILEAPTGFGKSAVAVAVARMYGPAHMLTTQKILQDQYMRDFSDHLFLSKGKKNYWCESLDIECGSKRCKPKKTYLISGGESEEIFRGCDDEDIRNLSSSINNPNKAHQTSLNYVGPEKYVLSHYDLNYDIRTCEYKANWLASRICKHTLHNFHSFIFQGVLAEGHKKRPMLIIDEAHNIENVILGFFEISINSELLGMEEFPVIRNTDEIIQFLTKDNFYEKAKALMAGYGVDIDKIASYIEEETKDDDAYGDIDTDTRLGFCSRATFLIGMAAYLHKESKDHKEYEKYKFLAIKIGLLSSYAEDGREFVASVERNKKGHYVLTAKPVYIDFWCKNLFGFGGKLFLTSATFPDKYQGCKYIGIEPDDVVHIKMPSEFPVKNRVIYVLGRNDVGVLTKDSLEKNLPNAVEVIRKIISCDKYKNEHGIIHTHSNKITDYIALKIHDRRLLFEKDFRYNKNDMLKFHAGNKGTILVAPGMSEGLDLSDDLSRFQIILKVPYPGIDMQIKYRLERYGDWDWYNYQAVLKLMQSYGRSVRHKEDWADTYILDASFYSLYLRYKDRFFAPWFREALSFRETP